MEVFHAIDKILDLEWQIARLPEQKKKIREMGAWFIRCFCADLCGEEMIMLKLAGTANSLVNMSNGKDAHLLFVILGCTKRNQLWGATFAIPCAPVTEGAHLRPGPWVKPLVAVLHSTGKRSGKLFGRRLWVPKLHEFENAFFTVLEKFQSTTNLLSNDLVIQDKCGISRTIWRSLTAHSRTCKFLLNY
jgi:hypothetical protein